MALKQLSILVYTARVTYGVSTKELTYGVSTKEIKLIGTFNDAVLDCRRCMCKCCFSLHAYDLCDY